MKFRFHVLALPHTTTSRDFNACAYTQKNLKFIQMMTARGHTCIHYGNEGSTVPCEHVQIFTEAERQGWFGAHDKSQLYHLDWNEHVQYWQVFTERVIPELGRRVRRGDFILTVAGNCHQAIGHAFPGSYADIPVGPMMVEYGIGYYGTFSRYRVFESHAHREWWHGRADNTQEDNDDAVVPNYFDRRDFPLFARDHEERTTLLTGLSGAQREKLQRFFADPYYLFIGRLIPSKGWNIAVDVTADLGARLVLVGQGDPGKLPEHVLHYGHASIEERGVLAASAIATFAPTHYREPFGGTAVETQLSGTPAITTDHGAFVETVDPTWRCASHREFVEAAIRARSLSADARLALRERALAKYSFEAVAPLYERYFSRLYARWGRGWYEMRDLDLLAPPENE